MVGGGKGDYMRILFIDLDGTLLTDEKQITQESKNVLKLCHEKGILVGFITARTTRKLWELIKCVPCDFVASYDGALIEVLSDGKFQTIFNRCLDKEVAFSIIEDLSRRPDCDVFAYFEPFYLMNTTVSSNETNSLLQYEQVRDKLPGCQRIRGRFFTHQNPCEFFSDMPVDVYAENHDIVIRAIGANKRTAVKAILEHFGINKEAAVAIGDGEPDIEMFNECGIGIAMGNAPFSVKSAASFVTDTNNNNGVAKAINLLLSENENSRLL